MAADDERDGVDEPGADTSPESDGVPLGEEDAGAEAQARGAAGNAD